jgi:hypothetical protein
MALESELPPIRKIKLLADWGGPFPIQNRHLKLAAERFGFGEKVIHFLDLFPQTAVFRTRNDFIHQCEVVEAFIRAKQEMPTELIDLLQKPDTTPAQSFAIDT